MRLSEPPYLRLKDQIAAGVADGSYKPHSKLPSQRELGEEFGVSHMTVRRAINELIQEGLIYARAGTGLFVAEPRQAAELGPLIGFTEDMRMRGMVATSRTLDKRFVPASALLADVLDVVAGQPVLFLRRLRMADGEPMAVQNAYLPAAMFPGLADEDFDSVSLYELLFARYGIRGHGSRSSAGAKLASEEEAALLGLRPPAALLATEQITIRKDGKPIECVQSLYRGDRYQMQLTPHGGATP